MTVLQVDRLGFIASETAVGRHGNEENEYEQDVPALCEVIGRC